MSNAVFIVESQPPKFSEVYALFSIIDQYDNILLCVQNTPMVLPTQTVLALWDTIIEPYRDKITLSFSEKDFKSMAQLPKEYHDYKLLTIEPEIFVHLQSLNFDTGLLPRIEGYENVFLRAAFRQSKALSWLRRYTAKK